MAFWLVCLGILTYSCQNTSWDSDYYRICNFTEDRNMYGLTPREEQIMNTIWNMDHPCLISEILKASPALKRNTVAPALVVLENKGYLKVDSIGKSYTRTGKAYVAAISKEAYKEQQAFLNAISQSRDTETGVLDFLTAYVKSKNMSADFPQRIREILEHY